MGVSLRLCQCSCLSALVPVARPYIYLCYNVHVGMSTREKKEKAGTAKMADVMHGVARIPHAHHACAVRLPCAI